MTKSISTLIPDIQRVLEEGVDKVDEHKIEAFAKVLANTLAAKLKKRDKNELSISRLGHPDRKLWYGINKPECAEKMSAETLLKFMYGDLIEELVLFLADVAGHDVQHRQEVVEINGVQGHIDAVVDGVLVDVKSASKFGFEKFARGTLHLDDPFGYMDQLNGYLNGLGDRDLLKVKKQAAFLAVSKEDGKIGLLVINKEEKDLPALVEHKKAVVSLPSPPDRCYSDVAEGASGNRKLGVNCSYCQFKKECWKDSNGGEGLRTYTYSKGPVFLTHVEKEPKVERSF